MTMFIEAASFTVSVSCHKVAGLCFDVTTHFWHDCFSLTRQTCERAHACTRLQVTSRPCTCDMKHPERPAGRRSTGLSMAVCVRAPCTTVGRKDGPLRFSSSVWGASVCAGTHPCRSIRSLGAMPACQSAPCLVTVSGVTRVSLLSFILPGPLSSLYPCSFCSLFSPPSLASFLSRSAPLSLAACNPGAWQAGQAAASASTSLAAWQWGTSVTGCNQTCLETEQEERGGRRRWRQCKWGGGPLLLPD